MRHFSMRPAALMYQAFCFPDDSMDWTPLHEQCCGLQCGDSGAEASLFGVGAYDDHHEYRNAFCSGSRITGTGDEAQEQREQLIEQCYRPQCVVSHFHWFAFFVFVLPATILSTAIEIGWMYYDTLR